MQDNAPSTPPSDVNEVPSPGVGGGSVQPVSQQAPQSPGGKRWPVWLVAALVIIVLAVIAWLVLRPDSATKPANQQPVHHGSNNPAHLDGIAVGTYPYVIACVAFSPDNQTNSFAGVAGDSLIDATYAEEGLPVGDIPPSGVLSSCSREFGSDTAYSGNSLIFNIYQFDTPTAAQKYYDTVSVSQKDLDKANQQFGGHLSTDYTPFSGATNTVYSPTQHTSYTLERNTVFSFSLVGSAPASYTGDLKQAITLARSNIDSAKPGRLTPPVDSAGSKIGGATILNPCAVFTGSSYQQATGNQPDPSQVEVRYQYGADQYFPTDTSEGWATNSCERVSYPGTKSGARNITAELQYYKTTDDAAAGIKQQAQKFSGDSSYQPAEPVSDVGSYAVFIKPKASGSSSYLYVQQGPYVLAIHGSAVSGAPLTSPDYQKLAKLLLPKLP